MKYAALVYIHGGEFEWGSSDLFDGKYLSAYGGIIVVTFNYRLELLGFLQLDENDAPGNVCIWDQKRVLEWVNKTIESFGGDKAKVSILGLSAGAVSATILVLYPENKGLFQRVLVHGHSVTSPEYKWNSGNTLETDYVVRSLGCSS
ncbi:cholinesterase 2-like [Ruditapes philippinarum]|uniref:cholinesterase 2-like n=1 Tax=Ruditapes philippinarum TaxID=129788 RepID=UPI00295B1B0D|nr:cholinesterase 2-like [Ruditapes philippinarum]